LKSQLQREVERIFEALLGKQDGVLTPDDWRTVITSHLRKMQED